MSNSENRSDRVELPTIPGARGPKGTVYVRALPRQVHIHLFDHQLRHVARGVGELKKRVPTGLYELRYETGLNDVSEMVSVRSGPAPPAPREVTVPFPCAAPFPNTIEYRPELGAAARDLSRKPGPQPPGGCGRLMIFARDSAGEPRWQPTLGGLALLDEALRPTAEGWPGAESGDGWTGWCADRASGGYVLRWLHGTGEGPQPTGSIDQALWVSAGWTTMVFLAAQPHIVLEKEGTDSWLVKVASLRLDRACMTIHMARAEVGFEPDHPDAGRRQWAMELALAGWQRRRRFLSENRQELDDLLEGKYANPLFGVVAAHILWATPAPNRKLLRTVQRRLEELAPDLPDVIVLAELMRLQGRGGRPKRSSPRPRLPWPPMLEASFRAAIDSDWEGGTLIVPQSAAGRAAARLLSGAVWTTWSESAARGAESAGAGEEEAEALGSWLAGALRAMPSLRDVTAEFGWGREDGAALWRRFAGSADPVVQRLAEQVQRLYQFAVHRGRFEELRTQSLTDVARGLDLPPAEVTPAMTRLLAEGRTASASPPTGWPPQDGRAYIHGDDFGRLLLEVVEPLMRRYPGRDFVDAAADVFSWLSGKLRKNRRFLNTARFPTEGHFRAYLRQAAWNAARMAERRRRSHEPLAAASARRDLSLEPLQLAALRESIAALPEPHKTVLQQLFFEQHDAAAVGALLGKTPPQLEALVAEAVDRLRLE